MTPQTRNFALVSPAVLAEKIKAAGGPAIDPTQPTGKATAKGVTLSWVVSPGAIAITVDSKPWDFPMGVIWEHITSLFPS